MDADGRGGRGGRAATRRRSLKGLPLQGTRAVPCSQGYGRYNRRGELLRTRSLHRDARHRFRAAHRPCAHASAHACAQGKLFRRVNAEESDWTIEDEGGARVLKLTLVKSMPTKGTQHWSGLLLPPEI